MTRRFLLDTHVVVQWLSAPKKLSSEQGIVVREAERAGETLSISACTLIEIAILAEDPRKIKGPVDYIFSELESNPMFEILPITIPIAVEAAALTQLRDHRGRTIVATARVHNLRLLTSDQRIIDSKLVPVVD